MSIFLHNYIIFLQTLRNIVKDCLKKVQDDRLKSIAIPAIGTGNHKFPHSTVANIFFEESLKFLADNPQTTLCDIRFVAYHKDQPSIDAFVNAIKARRPTASATPRKDGRDEEASGNKDIPSAAGPAFLVFETGDGVTLIDDKKIKAKSGQTLSVVVGDLSNQRVKVIIRLRYLMVVFIILLSSVYNGLKISSESSASVLFEP